MTRLLSVLVAATALVGLCADEVIHDDPVVLDNDGQLDTTGLCSTRYLFGSVFTNAYHKTNPRPYLERSRGIVDLNGDGKLDVILEFNESYRARIGNGYNVFLWTNGLYRCVGEIWGAEPPRVENHHYFGTSLWTYSPCSGVEGSFCRLRIGHYGQLSESSQIRVDWHGDGVPCIARALDDAILRHANKPVRWERSETRRGVVRWIPHKNAPQPSIEELMKHRDSEEE